MTLVVALAVLLVTAALILLALRRRSKRSGHFRALDDLQHRCAPLMRALLDGEVDCRTGVEQLRRQCGPEQIQALETVLLAALRDSGQVTRAGDVAEALGLVDLWQRQLRGEAPRMRFREELTQPEHWLEELKALQFVIRARAVENLRRVGHRPSWPLLTEALSDPHTEVESVAVRALGALGEPESFPLLVRRLHEAVLSSNPSRVSVRTLKAALVRFPLELATDLLLSLQHDHPRIRFLAADIIRDMAERDCASRPEGSRLANFPPQLAEAFLTRLIQDQNADVRARAAEVIGYFEDPRVTPALTRLADDPVWFVRLHATRAIARRGDAGAEDILAGHLTDSHWRVREAAVKGCVQLGERGVQKLIDHFLLTSDRYSREQITEEMERCGLIPLSAAEPASGDRLEDLRALLERFRASADTKAGLAAFQT